MQGIEDLGVIVTSGSPELRIELNEQSLARYGVKKMYNPSSEMAIVAVSQLHCFTKMNAGFQHHGAVQTEYRQNEEMGKILVPERYHDTHQELAEIKTITGPLRVS